MLVALKLHTLTLTNLKYVKLVIWLLQSSIPNTATHSQFAFDLGSLSNPEHTSLATY